VWTHMSRHSNTSSPGPSIPATREALARLQTEADRLAASLAAVQAEAQATGVLADRDAPTVLAAGELHLVQSRRRALRRILAAARVGAPNGAPVVGSRATVQGAAGEVADYLLVAPGFVDPARAEPSVSRVSYQSPLGAALLGRHAGQEVVVAAPDAVGRVRLAHVD
jgi:transcription elongation GreA/GreB family factor